MRKLFICSFVLICACAAWYSGADGKAVVTQEISVSRNAFIEVTPPAGQKVKWISENDFFSRGRAVRVWRKRRSQSVPARVGNSPSPRTASWNSPPA